MRMIPMIFFLRKRWTKKEGQRTSRWPARRNVPNFAEVLWCMGCKRCVSGSSAAWLNKCPGSGRKRFNRHRKRLLPRKRLRCIAFLLFFGHICCKHLPNNFAVPSSFACLNNYAGGRPKKVGPNYFAPPPSEGKKRENDPSLWEIRI